MKADNFTKGFISKLQDEDRKKGTVIMFCSYVQSISTMGALVGLIVGIIIGIVLFPDNIKLTIILSSIVGYITNCTYLYCYKYGKIIKKYF